MNKRPAKMMRNDGAAGIVGENELGPEERPTRTNPKVQRAVIAFSVAMILPLFGMWSSNRGDESFSFLSTNEL